MGRDFMTLRRDLNCDGSPIEIPYRISNLLMSLYAKPIIYLHYMYQPSSRNLAFQRYLGTIAASTKLSRSRKDAAIMKHAKPFVPLQILRSFQLYHQHGTQAPLTLYRPVHPAISAATMRFTSTCSRSRLLHQMRRLAHLTHPP